MDGKDRNQRCNSLSSEEASVLAEAEDIMRIFEVFGPEPVVQAFIEKAGALLLGTPRGYVVCTGLPQPCGWQCDENARWRRCRPRLPSAGRAFRVWPEVSDQERRDAESPFLPASIGTDTMLCLRRYLCAYPQDWVELLKGFHSPHSFHLLQFWAAGGWEITRHYPLLGFAASLRNPIELPTLAYMDAMTLVTTLGFGGRHPSTALRILAKLPPEEVNMKTLRQFVNVLTSPRALRQLACLDRVTSQCLSLLSEDTAPHVGPELLIEASQTSSSRQISVRLQDTVRLARQLRARLPVFASAMHLYGVHVWLRQRQKRQQKGVHDWVFRPPFAGLETRMLILEPIHTAIQAIVEGRRLDVCIGDPLMLERLRRGNLAAYRMHVPQRATVTIMKTDIGWYLKEIALPGNQGEVDPRTRALVIEWLNEQQEGLLAPAQPDLI